MKILLTGASGFLGSRCAAVLRGAGHTVLAPPHHACDLTDGKALAALFARQEPEAVVHTAAIADIGACERDRDLAYDVNVKATQQLCRLAAELPFVFISSDQVYNPSLCRPLTEDLPVDPQNYYGRTKVWAEDAVRQLGNGYCLRITWQFSAPEEPGFARSTGILSAARRAMETGEPVRVGARSGRYLTWCYDTAGVVLKAVAAAFEPGTYNVASRNDRTDRETYELVFRALGAGEDRLHRLIAVDGSYAPRLLTADPARLESRGVILPEFSQSLGRALGKSTGFDGK